MPRECKWILEVDGQRHDVPTLAALETILKSSSRAREITLELVKPQTRPRWEKLLYRALGLVLEETISLGTLEVMLGQDVAYVCFTKNDDDVGSIAVGKPAQVREQASVTFETQAGEPVTVERRDCIDPAIAIELLRQFHGSKKRPSTVTWRAVA